MSLVARLGRAIRDHMDPYNHRAEPDETMECSQCEGSGCTPRGDFGSYYRDGDKYDAPGWEICLTCDGTGQVDGS